METQSTMNVVPQRSSEDTMYESDNSFGEAPLQLGICKDQIQDPPLDVRTLKRSSS